jgi:hypothetical protein
MPLNLIEMQIFKFLITVIVVKKLILKEKFTTIMNRLAIEIQIKNPARSIKSVFINLFGFKSRLKTNFDITVPVVTIFLSFSPSYMNFQSCFSTTICLEGFCLL